MEFDELFLKAPCSEVNVTIKVKTNEEFKEIFCEAEEIDAVGISSGSLSVNFQAITKGNGFRARFKTYNITGRYNTSPAFIWIFLDGSRMVLRKE
jgi:ribosomal protein L3